LTEIATLGAGADPGDWPATRVDIVDTTSPKPHPSNSRTHAPKQIREIANLMLEVGWTTAMLLDDEGYILAGHGRQLAALLLVSEGHPRFAKCPVMRASGWSDAQKRAYIIADNRIALSAGWNAPLLATELQSLSGMGFNMDLLGFGRGELKRAMGDAGGGRTSDPDATPAPPIVPVTKPRDVWVMDGHRLMCGDATITAHVSVLLDGRQPICCLTDPPYCSGGCQEAGRASGSIGARQVKAGKAHEGGVANDKLSTRGYLALMKGVLALAPVEILYAFTDWRMWTNLYDVAESSGFGVRNMIVWDKGHPGMGRGWRTQHELVLFGARSPLAFLPKFAQGNVISAKRTGNKLHPTQKPVDLLAAVLAVTSMADEVYDPFTGSGSTLMACQQEGRTFVGMELKPGFVDVSVRRWQDFTGKPAVLARTGETFDAIAKAMEGDDSAAWT
jgi:DNA modification methylase